MAHEKQLANVKYRNWVKGGLSLKYLKEGCEKFIDETVSDQHSKIVAAIKGQYPNAREKCNTCELPKLKPLHSKDRHGQCSLGQKPVCNCLNVKGKNVCPDKICSAMYDKIIFQHRYSSPNWKNTNIRDWFSNHWELAKCNISAGGYDKKKTAADTDCLGLLSIAINDQEIQTRLDLVIDPPHDLFSQTRKARDEIFHSSTLELDDATVQKYIDDMIQILEDKKELIKRAEAKEAVKKLTQLKDDSFVVTNMDEMEIRRKSIEAIHEKEVEAINAIEQKQNEVICKIRSNDMRTEFLHLEQSLQAAENDIRASGARMNTLESRQAILEATVNALYTKNEYVLEELQNMREELAKVSKYKTVEDLHRERIEYLGRKRELQALLIKQYQKYYISIPLQPLIQEEDANIQLSVRPYITAVRNINKEDAEDHVDCNESDDSIISYKDIFTGKESQNRNIYLTGDAGSGKSILCKQVIADWCNIQSNKSGEYVFNNEDVLLKFEFLFFVSLVHSSRETHIHEMIKNQLFRGSKYVSIFDEIVQNESDSCLIILDGLDEWKGKVLHTSPSTSPHVPNRNNINQYTILTTTRPWKFETMHLKTYEYDLIIKIHGLSLDSANTLIDKIVCNLNSKHGEERGHGEFSNDFCSCNLSAIHFSMFIKTPILLVYLVHRWFDGKQFGPSRCDIYLSIIVLFLKNAETKEKETNSEVLLLQYSDLSAADQQSSLPKIFQKYVTCVNYKKLLLVIARFAFDRLFADTDSYVFDESAMQKSGLTKQDITVCQQIGFFTISTMNLNSTRKSSEFSFSFPHKTLQDFLAALWLAIDYSTDETMSSFYGLLKDISSKSTEDEENSSVIAITTFLFGLNPEVGNCVYEELESALLNLTEFDENLFTEINFRTDTLLLTSLFSIGEAYKTLNATIYECFLCGYKDVKLRKKYCIGNDINFIEHYDTSYLKVIELTETCSSKEYVRANTFPSLEYLFASGCESDFKMASVFLQKASGTLKCIDIGSMITSDMTCNVDFRNLHKTFFELLPNLQHLQSLCLCRTSFDHPSMNWFLHDIQSQSRKMKLTDIVLKYIHCLEHDDQCEGKLDLSEHFFLRNLGLLDIPVRSVKANTRNLKHCRIYSQLEFTISFAKMEIEISPYKTNKLQTLTLNYPCSIQQQSQLRKLLLVIQYSSHLRYLSLTNVYFAEIPLKLNPQNTEIEDVKLQTASMTKNAFCKFIDSIPATSRCNVEIANLIIIPMDDYDDAIKYAGRKIQIVQNIYENPEPRSRSIYKECCFI